MHAAAGDWLIVKGGRDSRASRRAAIIATAAGGAPPYTVRWLDTGRESLVFPGPDAVVMTAAHQLELDREQTARAVRIQAEIVRPSS